MKLVAVGSLLLLAAASATARADIKPVRDYRWAGAGPVGTRPAVQAAISSHVLFLNNCKTANCTIVPGNNDSRTNHSSIADHTGTLTPFPYNDTTWNQIVDCVKQTYAPFNIQIVTTEPASNTSYFEEMVAGTCNQIDSQCPAGVVGVAPFSCGVIDNAITYAFAADSYYQSNTVTNLCWTIAQESAHAFGLDHEFLAADPMTYLNGSTPKRFQNKDAQCGRDQVESCLCGGSTQNSVTMLTSILGSGTPTPPKVTITDPTNGATVQPGFPVHATITDADGIDHVELRVDNKLIMSLSSPPFAFNAATDTGQGNHHVEVRAYDSVGTPGSGFIDVVIGAPCTQASGCTGTNVCVDGRCVAGPDATGGLGDTCTKASDCISNACNSAGSEMHCTEACDPAKDGCPTGFGCAATTQAGVGVCWPGLDNGGGSAGGCNAEGGGSVAPIGVGLLFGALLLGRRRRK